MILSQGMFKLVEDISNDMANGEAGTDTTLFDKSQTGVITAIAATDIVLTDKVFSAGTINATYILTIALANGEDVSEFEVNDGAGTAYNRILKTTRLKTSDDEFSIFHTFEFQIII